MKRSKPGVRKKRSPRGGGDAVRIGELLELSVEGLPEGPQKDDMGLGMAWLAAVGEVIASHSQVVGINGQTLFISIDTLEWFFTISRLRQKILDQCHELSLLRQIEFLVLKMNYLPDAQEETKATQESAFNLELPPLGDDDAREINDMVKTIEDRCIRLQLRHFLQLDARKQQWRQTKQLRKLQTDDEFDTGDAERPEADTP